MKRNIAMPLLVAAVLGSWDQAAQAQLFGTQGKGGTSIVSKLRKSTTSSTASSSSSSSTSSPGDTGTARFLRGNRSKDDFVGTGSKENRGFVGREEASPNAKVRTAVSDLKVETGPNVNQAGPLVPSRAGMYQPRLAVGFDFTRPQMPAQGSGLQERLKASPSIRWSGPCEVSVEGQTATLRGTVASGRDRKLAELLVLLEPGIAKVQNELRIASPPASAASAASPAVPPASSPENRPSPGSSSPTPPPPAQP